MKTDTPTVEELAERKYKYGFVSDIESETVPPGLDEGTVRFISAKKKRTGMAARMAARGLSTLAKNDRTELGVREVYADRLSSDQLLVGTERSEGRTQESR